MTHFRSFVRLCALGGAIAACSSGAARSRTPGAGGGSESDAASLGQGGRSGEGGRAGSADAGSTSGSTMRDGSPAIDPPVVPRLDASVARDVLSAIDVPRTIDTANAAPTPSTCLTVKAPAWFVNTPEGIWTTVAGATGETLADHLPSPIPRVSGFPGSPSAITTAWTGGAVDQARGEYILAGNGGHADYPGNEGYGIALRDAKPAWRRLADPTPNDQIGDVTSEGNGLYADGRPRSMHSSFECFGDGRVWFPLQNSITSGGGGTYNRVVAFNRDALGAAAMPLAWTRSNLGAWEVYGAPFPAGTGLTAMIFGVCAFDPVGHKVWALGGNSANYTIYWSVETSGAGLGKTSNYRKGQSFGHWGSWVTVAADLRILVAADHARQQITVLNLDIAGQAGDWQAVNNVTGPGFYPSGAGAAYIQAGHSIAAGDPRSDGKTIRKLQIPTKTVGGKVVYDSSGQWVWTMVTPGGADIVVLTRNSSPYTKWNIIEDMCNGHSALVYLPDIRGPVYVYKVPTAGLP